MNCIGESKRCPRAKRDCSMTAQNSLQHRSREQGGYDQELVGHANYSQAVKDCACCTGYLALCYVDMESFAFQRRNEKTLRKHGKLYMDC